MTRRRNLTSLLAAVSLSIAATLIALYCIRGDQPLRRLSAFEVTAAPAASASETVQRPTRTGVLDAANNADAKQWAVIVRNGPAATELEQVSRRQLAVDRFRLVTFCNGDYVQGRLAVPWNREALDRAHALCADLPSADAADAALDALRDSPDLGSTESNLLSEARSNDVDQGVGVAEGLIRSSVDLEVLEAATLNLTRFSQSLSSRLLNQDVSQAKSLENERRALALYRCSILGNCSARSFQTIAYCVQARAPCPAEADLMTAYAETLPAYDLRAVSAVYSFLVSKPPRRLPPPVVPRR